MSSALDSLTERVRAAAADHTRLSIRGGGTKDFYGQPAEGEILDTRPLTGIVDFEPSELVVTAMAGTPLSELQAVLAEKGQCLPFDPPHFAVGATVGGMVAAGLSGPARAAVGSVRDYVLGAQLLNGRAELLDFGGQVMKNVAGYDVSRLLAGSLGTLGLITRVSLKVLPIAPAEATLHFDCDQDEALELLHGWGGQPWPLDASRWALQDPADPASGALHLRLRGAVAAVQSACAHLGGTRRDADEAGRAQAAADWSACRDHRLDWFAARAAGHDLWRLSVPQTTPVLAGSVAAAGEPLVEWHGGQRWYRADAADASLAAALRRAAADAGGHAVRFRCADPLAPDRFAPLSPALARIQEAIQHSFDPGGIFHRGRLHAAAA
ncbi:glycolate oxidase subunit GlcE [Xylophilus sp. GOD-11R]|uniref:glycolate oxidase subunit GlcE n=1 Tax=Xylophilus sp. GOD-11R TaxID=3089814 RepID=UPI00298C4653|nr:glycolate oxidase subunit GlcE [Xylophilus sp. GOD-11R]WPB56839.1 glycolate oxidase subunit GlcE [Xylophilus sp. GOD-11R]